MSVAEEILNQIGGAGKVSAMLGVKNFVGGENYLRVDFKVKSKNKINSFTITLNAMDTYDIEFGRKHKVKGFPTYTKISEHKGCYNDMLVELIETELGNYLSL